MKVIVFGATGTVGKLAVQEMLSDGYEVTAFARSPQKLSLTHSRLRRVAGDARDANTVRRAIEGHDAVVIALGSGMSRTSTIRSEGTQTIIQAMQETSVRRLICQSTLGAHESWSNLNFFWKRIMFGFLLRPVFLDHERQETMVRESGLDWTIVRPGSFTEGPATGKYKEGFAPSERNLTLKISRLDIAQFLTRQLIERRYINRAVAISN